MKSRLFQESQTALEQENFSEALQKAQQLIAMDPGDYQSYLLYGDIFMGMDNGSKAAEHYEKALTIRPDHASAFFKLGNAYEMKEDVQNALQQYQSARRLDPANQLYIGYMGRLLHQKGQQAGNINYENDGFELMQQAYAAGENDANLREQLAIAHLGKAFATWRKHPEEGYPVATEAVHLSHASTHLEWVSNLYDRTNLAIAEEVARMEGIVGESGKRRFAGYFYLRKAPFIAGIILGIFGQTFFGIFLIILGVLYHVSQFQPGYMSNRQLFKSDYRPPLVIRRLEQINQELGGITIFSTSLSQLFFTKFLINLLGRIFCYALVIFMLPYEIIKGFLKNYDLRAQWSAMRLATARATAAARRIQNPSVAPLAIAPPTPPTPHRARQTVVQNASIPVPEQHRNVPYPPEQPAKESKLDQVASPPTAAASPEEAKPPVFTESDLYQPAGVPQQLDAPLLPEPTLPLVIEATEPYRSASRPPQWNLPSPEVSLPIVQETPPSYPANPLPPPPRPPVVERQPMAQTYSTATAPALQPPSSQNWLIWLIGGAVALIVVATVIMEMKPGFGADQTVVKPATQLGSTEKKPAAEHEMITASPTGVAQQFLDHTSQGKYEEAKAYGTRNTAKLLDFSKALLGSGTDKTFRFKILRESMEGDHALVFFYNQKLNKEESIDLVKVNQKWMVDLRIK